MSTTQNKTPFTTKRTSEHCHRNSPITQRAGVVRGRARPPGAPRFSEHGQPGGLPLPTAQQDAPRQQW